MSSDAGDSFRLPTGWRDAGMQGRRGADDELPHAVNGAAHLCERGFAFAANGGCPDLCELQCHAQQRMHDMRLAFAATGGLRSVGELAPGDDASDQARFADIARWIATRRIIGFMWCAQPWVPMFQFDLRPRLQPRRDLQPLFDLLAPLYEPWAMANWFARPNPWLSGRRPIDDCVDRLPAVLDVAHLEHFIATGQTQTESPAPSRSSGH